jgi:hypothetical protein
MPNVLKQTARSLRRSQVSCKSAFLPNAHVDDDVICETLRSERQKPDAGGGRHERQLCRRHPCDANATSASGLLGSLSAPDGRATTPGRTERLAASRVFGRCRRTGGTPCTCPAAVVRALCQCRCSSGISATYGWCGWGGAAWSSRSSLLVVGRDRLEDDRHHASRDPAGARTLPRMSWRGIDACRLTAIRSYDAAAYSGTEG